MPNTHSTLTALFTDIADAIREKDGTTTQKVADAFPAAIRAIPSGGGTDAEDGIITGTISGEYVNSRVTAIRYYAFANCQSLTTCNFANCSSVKTYAFLSCTKLRCIKLPKCTQIQTSAFAYCSSLESVYLTGSSIPSLTNSSVFNSTPLKVSTYLGHFGSIIVRASMINAFKSAAVWSVFSSRFSVWNEVD